MSRLFLLIPILCLVSSGCEIDPEATNSIITDDEVIIVQDNPGIPESDPDITDPDIIDPVSDPLIGSRVIQLNIESNMDNVSEIPEALMLDIEKIEIENLDTGLWVTCYAGTKSIDLLNYNNEDVCLFPEQEYTPGEYGQIRLHLNLNNNFVKFNETKYDLIFKQGTKKNGIKFAGGFTIKEGYTTEININFNIERYLRKKEHYYEVKPTIKISSTEVVF